MENHSSKVLDIVRAHYARTETSEEGDRLILSTLDNTYQAFGNCSVCWGKGYLVSAVGSVITIAAAEVEPAKRIINYCTCGRGEQLNKLSKDLP